MNDPREDRRTSWGADRDPAAYARRRARQARRRVALDRQVYDPTPPTDDDWVGTDRSQVTRLPTGPEEISAVLQEVIRQKGWDDRLRGAMLFQRWDQVVGAELAQHCQPVRLAGGVLTVAASSPQWATQLRYMTAQLQLNVNQALGEPLVDSVHITVGRTG